MSKSDTDSDTGALTRELAGIDARLALCKELIARHRGDLERLRATRDTLMARQQDSKERHVIPSHMVWDRQPWFVTAKERFGHVKGIPDIRCAFLQSCLRSVDRIPGDIAECGVRNGRSALFMLTALEVERRLFLFDSFEGLSDPLPDKDGLDTVIDPKSRNRLFHNDDLQGLLDRLEPFGDRVEVLRGWIPERFPEVADRRFCLVHLDVDLYRPTLDGLEFFYDRLEPGGILVCDDYGTGFYPGARQAMDEFFGARREKPVELPQGQAFVVKEDR